MPPRAELQIREPWATEGEQERGVTLRRSARGRTLAPKISPILPGSQHLEAYFHSEINTLGYPKAALSGFCLALVAYNLLAVVLAALRRVHGEELVDEEVSLYYIAN